MRISTLCIGFPALKICAHIIQRAFTVKHPPLELFQLPALFSNGLVDYASCGRAVTARRTVAVQRAVRGDAAHVARVPRDGRAEPPISCGRRAVNIVFNAVNLRRAIVERKHGSLCDGIVLAKAKLGYTEQEYLVAGGVAAAQRVARFIDRISRGYDVHLTKRGGKVRVDAVEESSHAGIVRSHVEDGLPLPPMPFSTS